MSKLSERADRTRAREQALVGEVAEAEAMASVDKSITVFKAIGDESEGEIEVKRVDSDGNVVGDAITLKVLP